MRTVMEGQDVLMAYCQLGWSGLYYRDDRSCLCRIPSTSLGHLLTTQIDQLRPKILMGIASYLEYHIYGSNSYPAFRMVSAYLAGMPETS